ncbi:hypothetical protein [Limnofasciculus baicalensis]|uniref:Uncharacterized protein n=1 Tax=Limnofasciculus baicalensis BBK-W-15 TaxID=2699891 RepID=A0AAE3GVM1_9CYAN|nr:hypothetical protein [Limnofasciculus baicalensis]MCP2731184.1 hypothetical protein [Limnofasciculus baicalensis BBK-W-15]
MAECPGSAFVDPDNAPNDRLRRATAELTPVDKTVETPLAEAGSKRQNKRVN